MTLSQRLTMSARSEVDMKRQCLVCRMGDDMQKVEPIEVLIGVKTGWTERGGPRLRVPLCIKHKDVKPVLLEVMTGES